jgi:hypothetical protein
MIDIILYYGTEIVFVRISGYQIKFATSTFGNRWTDISGLKLNKAGTLKTFPDLIDREDWKQEAIKRFKEHVQSLRNEEEICTYVCDELRKCGYIPKYKQKASFRREIIK